ncbi:MAG: hypothetical protein DME97_10915 [Verrucomicrobia bacterium]|nr:MAG: hypothetical protein DME97_10915 [Verrucomicrobiota bacterium]
MQIAKFIIRVALIVLGVALLFALLWTIAVPNDYGDMHIAIRTFFLLIAIPYHVLLVAFRMDSFHSGRTAAMILTVVTIEIGIFAAVRTLGKSALRKKSKREGEKQRRGQS